MFRVGNLFCACLRLLSLQSSGEGRGGGGRGPLHFPLPLFFWTSLLSSPAASLRTGTRVPPCAWVSLALPLTSFLEERKSPLFQFFLETQSLGTLLTRGHKQNKKKISRCMRAISHEGGPADPASLSRLPSAAQGCF